MFRELNEMCNLQYLPLKKEGIEAHYEGSIDKKGGNRDWDWVLYKESNKNEWVIFEHIGPGCIMNFVQHRYLESTEVIFRFYFDGEEKHSFEIKPCEFGEKYPFLEPIASKFISTVKTPIRVVRSFVPMPFAKSCKVTSSLPLINGTSPEGGWGHIVYHTYSKDLGTQTFNPENRDYMDLIKLWSQCGKNPIKSNNKNKTQSFVLKPGETITIFEDDNAGLITGLKFKTNFFNREDLRELKICAKWDNRLKPDVVANFGCLFSNEFGINKTSYLLAGNDSDGEYYCYYPMPYKNRAEIIIENTGKTSKCFDLASVTYTSDFNDLYTENNFGYFSTSDYYERKCTRRTDSIIANVLGSGHIVSSIITGYGMNDGANCEGDARIHFNNIRTPQIESDGSESYSCYGWGFCQPPQCNPASGYDGFYEDGRVNGWSMTRHLMSDYYPFRSGFRFGIESFGWNDKDMEHSGMVFYYNTGDSCEYKIADIIIGNSESESASSYKSLDNSACISETSFFEGDDDEIKVSFKGRYTLSGSSFEIDLEENTKQVVVRRVSNQKIGRQLATVYVDNEEVIEYPWYFPDHNQYKCWLEDEFIIPEHYIKNKNHANIKIVPKECDEVISFNEFNYTIFGVK